MSADDAFHGQEFLPEQAANLFLPHEEDEDEHAGQNVDDVGRYRVHRVVFLSHSGYNFRHPSQSHQQEQREDDEGPVCSIHKLSQSLNI